MYVLILHFYCFKYLSASKLAVQIKFQKSSYLEVSITILYPSKGKKKETKQNTQRCSSPEISQGLSICGMWLGVILNRIPVVK